MGKITLTESQLRQLVENTVKNIIDESNLEELNIPQTIGAAVNGAKRGVNTARSLTNHNADYSHHNGLTAGNNFWGKWNDPNQRPDAIDGKGGIRDIIEQAKYYEALAKQLRQKADELAKYHGAKENKAGRMSGMKGGIWNYENDTTANRDIWNQPGNAGLAKKGKTYNGPTFRGDKNYLDMFSNK